MKRLVVNGLEYSKESFDEYKFRAKIMVITAAVVKGNIVRDKHHFDVYTTDKSITSVENVLLERKTDKVTSLVIINWSTREQDDATTKLIEEFLNEH